MRIFNWEANFNGDCLASGYLLAGNRKEAEEKLQFVPFYGQDCVQVVLANSACGVNGCEVNKDGIAVAWKQY